MRKGELNGITWGDVDLEKDVVTLRAEITKASQTREVPLNIHASGAFRRVMGRWVKTEDKASVKVFGFAKNIWDGKVLQQTCEKAGIPYGSNSGGLGYHTFRHSFITHSELVFNCINNSYMICSWAGGEDYAQELPSSSLF